MTMTMRSTRTSNIDRISSCITDPLSLEELLDLIRFRCIEGLRFSDDEDSAEFALLQASDTLTDILIIIKENIQARLEHTRKVCLSECEIYRSHPVKSGKDSYYLAPDATVFRAKDEINRIINHFIEINQIVDLTTVLCPDGKIGLAVMCDVRALSMEINLLSTAVDCFNNGAPVNTNNWLKWLTTGVV